MNGEQTLKLLTDPKRTVALSGNRAHKIGLSVDSRTVRKTIICRMAHAVSRLYKEGYDTYLFFAVWDSIVCRARRTVCHESLPGSAADPCRAFLETGAWVQLEMAQYDSGN